MSDAPQLERALAAIDAANADDPDTIVIAGQERPKEHAHAELMSDWVRRLDPEATDAQLLAARAHHLRRWTIPRSSYPEGRAGYLRWRTTLKKQHAREVAEILEREGYEPAVIERVQQIVRKDGLGHDAAVQTHEDALCLVFLQTQLLELAAEQGEEKTIEIVRKTTAKMSARGIAAASALELTPEARALVERAMTATEKP